MKSKELRKEDLMFTNRALFALLVPIIVEQFLNSLMGMADTMMVSNVGSTVVSAVSLVDSINTLVIQVFSALATGAAIVCSQYIGNKDQEGGNKAARQVVLTVFTISIIIMFFGLLFKRYILNFVFGKVEDGVMDNALIYFSITVCSYPFLALFNAGAALFRAGGNSRYPMKVSVVSNVMNVAGNAILIFGFGMGAAGAALATLLSRVFSTVVIYNALRKPKQVIVVDNYLKIRPHMSLIKTILAIGIPSGIENGMFQFGKLAIQSTVSTMGTTAIAAQAMTNIFENLNGIFGIGVGMGLMTIVGQCIGADKPEQAKYYIKKAILIAEAGVLASCITVYLLARPITVLAGMEPDSAKLCIEMVTAITLVKPIAWVFSFVPVYGMRAAGDVRFSMITSSISMWCCRVALCIFCVKVFGMGPMAVWIGMFTDWSIRSIVFGTRFLSGKWIKDKLI